MYGVPIHMNETVYFRRKGYRVEGTVIDVFNKPSPHVRVMWKCHETGESGFATFCSVTRKSWVERFDEDEFVVYRLEEPVE